MQIREIPLGSDLDNPYIDFINKYRGHPTNPKSYRWQFSYIPEKTVITGIVNKGEVLGSQCMMPLEILTQNGSILSGKCENSYLDESLRGGNHFLDMFSFASNICSELKIDLLWAFTPALKPYSRLGFSVYPDCLISFLIFIKIPSTKRYFSNRKGISLLKGIGSYGFLLFSIPYINILLLFNKILGRNLPISVTQSLKNSGDIDVLQEEIRKKYPSLVHINHSTDFLKWRIHQNPNINFEHKYFYVNDGLIGYCFYSNNNGDAQIRNLVYANLEDVQAILIELIKSLRKENIRSLQFHGNYENELNKAVFDNLRKLNFRKIHKTGMSFVYKFINENDKTVNESNWYINNLWTEGY